MLDTAGIAIAQKAVAGQTVEVRFVRPVISTILACSRIMRGGDPVVSYKSEEASDYAGHSGLEHAIRADYAAMVRLSSDN